MPLERRRTHCHLTRGKGLAVSSANAQHPRQATSYRLSPTRASLLNTNRLPPARDAGSFLYLRGADTSCNRCTAPPALLLLFLLPHVPLPRLPRVRLGSSTSPSLLLPRPVVRRFVSSPSLVWHQPARETPDNVRPSERSAKRGEAKRSSWTTTTHPCTNYCEQLTRDRNRTNDLH